MSLQWTLDLAVNNDEIDTQHKELFARADALVMAIEHGRGRQQVMETIRFLETYVRYHFSAEERLMEKACYPGLAAHQNAHVTFANGLTEWKARYEAEGPGHPFDPVIDLQHRLVVWLREHVLTLDREFAQFLKSRR